MCQRMRKEQGRHQTPLKEKCLDKPWRSLPHGTRECNKYAKKIQQKLVISLILSSWIRQKEYHSQLSIYVTTTHFQLQRIPIPIEEGETHQDMFTGQRKESISWLLHCWHCKIPIPETVITIFKSHSSKCPFTTSVLAPTLFTKPYMTVSFHYQ